MIENPDREIKIAIVGKYIDLPDAYISLMEAIKCAAYFHGCSAHIEWVESDFCEDADIAQEKLGAVDGICIPGGFGIRGIEGKIKALQFARTRKIPTLGICLGLQCMVIEYARNVAGIEEPIRRSSAQMRPTRLSQQLMSKRSFRARKSGWYDALGRL